MRVASFVFGAILAAAVVLAIVSPDTAESVWASLTGGTSHSERVVRSTDNVRTLVTLMIARRSAGQPAPRGSGKAFLDGLLADMSAEEREAFSAMKLSGPRPDDASEPGPAPLIGDLSFEDGAVVGYANGAARFLDREALGLGPHDPIVAGPASKSPVLRRLASD